MNQTTRTGTEPQKWSSHRGLSAGRVREVNGGNSTGNKKHNWQVHNRQGEIKNSIGNGEAKELICTIHGHERSGECWREWAYRMEGDNKGEKKIGTTVIA